MIALTEFLSSPVAERIGLTLLHSLWQLTFVAVLVFLILRSLRHSSPNVRYVFCCAALLLMVAIPVLTFASLQVDEQTRPRLAEGPEPAPLSVSKTPSRVTEGSLLNKQAETEKLLLPVEGKEASQETLPPQQTPPSSVLKPIENFGVDESMASVAEVPVQVAPSQVTTRFSFRKSLNALRQRLVPWSPWITFVWFVGFTIVAIRNVGGWQATRRLRCLSNDVDHPHAHSLLRKLAERLGIGCEVRLRESDLVRTPIVFGWLKPIILTPIGLLTQLSNAQLEALLAHELSHVQRNDYLCNGLQTLAESLLFFHPAVWWLSRRIRLEREYCCDDLAVKLCGDRLSYAEALATIEESLGTIGLGLSAGEKPLLKRVRRVLDVTPKPHKQFNLFGIWGASLLMVVSLGFVLVSSGQGSGGNVVNAMETSQPTAEVNVKDDKLCYTLLSELTDEIKKLLKSGRSEDAEKRILRELPTIGKAWLNDDFISLSLPNAKSLRETLAQDPGLLPVLIEKIPGLNQSEAVTAAMLDIFGQEASARTLYRKVLASDPDSLPTIRLHLFRLSGALDPGQLVELLSGKNLEPNKVRNALSSAFHASKTFDQSIAFMNAISKYLEQVKIAPDDRFDWVPGLDFGGNPDWRRNSVLGEYQLPNVWEPNAPHDDQMIGKPSNAAQVKIRRQAYQRYCKACLRIPTQASWAFTQLAAMADVAGEFDSNSKLVAQARKALTLSGKPTTERFITENKSPRFFSPELYLAYSHWKGKAKKDDLSELPESVIVEIERLQDLFSIPAAMDFPAGADAMLKEPDLLDELNQWDARTSEAVIASRRLNDILLIWNERQNDADCLDLMLSWAEKVKGAYPSREIAKIVVNYLRVVASKKPAKANDFLEALTTIYLGLPEDRANALVALPGPGMNVCWVQEPPAVQYLAILRMMAEEPVLIFPAIEKASELGLTERMRIFDWIEKSAFQAQPEQVIARLNLSPLVGELADFRLFPRGSGLQFPSNWPKESTLLEWVVAEIGKLNAAEQKPFRTYLASKKTFGAELMLALLSNQADAEITELLKANADKISKLSDKRKQEIGAFAIPKLSKDAVEVRRLFEKALGDENEVQLQRFTASLTNEAETVSMLTENKPGAVFLRFYQQDPELALRALRAAQKAQEEGTRKVSLFADEGNWFHESLASDLLVKIDYGTMNPPEQGRTATEFYLRVLADETLGPCLVVNEQLLTPRFSNAKTDVERLESLKNALVWTANVYPENLAKEYFFIATMQRWGHLTSKDKRVASKLKYRQEVVAALPPEFRDLATTALKLATLEGKYRPRGSVKPRWNEPEVAAAFEAVSKLLRNENAALNLRLAVASSVCDDCGFQTDPNVARLCGHLLAAAWSADIPVGRLQSVRILRVLSFQQVDESYLEVAKELTGAWKHYTDVMARETGEQVRNSASAIWITGLLAVLKDDDASFEEAISNQYRDLSEAEVSQLLPVLVAAGKTAEAAELVKLGAVDLAGRTSSDQRTFYDQSIHQHLPALLAEIDVPEERILAEAFLGGFGNWPFASDLPTREQRLLKVAEQVHEINFQRPVIRSAVYRLAFQERATAKLLAEGFVELVELDRLEEIVKTSERYGWVRLAEDMIHCVLIAGEIDTAMKVLNSIQKKSTGGDANYRTVWKAMSKGISSAKRTSKDDPEMLKKMAPVTEFMQQRKSKR